MSLLSQEYVYLPTVLRDSSELVQLLENTVVPESNCFLVTADVITLYPNVDTKKALVALHLLLREAWAHETPLLIQFARLVYLPNLGPDIFHQKFGIAIGTPFAVSAANALMFHHEKDISQSRYLTLCKRFIDAAFFFYLGRP